ncbi:hypothetical protein TGARI_362800 [Toxoplasma gondii ARI]|uniref:Transmembrane protein n=1 Tax=Toxoplasma gondii ARI TaxID=1074872 RepID=A0A139XW37_TOXGO|nr:hypothetical protein TGARI_362800 [Toxoplasma gondii ARI]
MLSAGTRQTDRNLFAKQRGLVNYLRLAQCVQMVVPVGWFLPRFATDIVTTAFFFALSGRPFCDSSHHLPNGEHYIGPDILKKSKRRDCKTHQSVWSACVNCRQLRYTHIIMHAALDGKPCPKERFEMRFCDPACEMWFTGGISSTRAPSTTAWSTRSTLRTTQVFTRNTTTTKEPLMIGGMPWYFIVAIAVANAGLLLVILGTAWCVLQRRHRQLSIILQMQESRELAEAEEKAHNAEALAAAAKEAARANVEGTPLASQPEAQSTTIKLTGTSPVHLKQRGWKTKDKRGKQHTSDAPVLRTPASKEEFFEPVP